MAVFTDKYFVFLLFVCFAMLSLYEILILRRSDFYCLKQYRFVKSVFHRPMKHSVQYLKSASVPKKTQKKILSISVLKCFKCITV